MATFKFYYDLMSPPSRALFILFNKLKVQYEPVKIALRKSEQLSDDFRLNVNRLQKIPVINHNGFRLSESVAILHYLQRQKLIPDTRYFPSDTKALARVDEYLEWTHNNIRIGGGMMFILKWAMPFWTGEFPDEKEVARYQKMYEQSLQTLEDVWLESTEFVAGNEISYADILAACDVEQTKIIGYDATQSRPKLQSWLKKVKEDTNPEFNEGHEFIYRYTEKYKGVHPLKSSL